MGCEGCARIILLIFNLIFFLIGAAALGVGIWVIVDGNIFLQVLGNIPNSDVYGSLIADAAYIIIGGGAFIFVVAFLGCCGAWKKNKCLLITYSIIIGVLLLLEIAVVVVAYFFYDQLIVIVNTQLAAALNSSYDSTTVATSTAGEYTYTPGSLFSKGVDAIQIEFECCGVHNYTDYENMNGTFPATCCPADTANADLKTLVDTLWKDEMTTYTTSATECYSNATYIEGRIGCSDAIVNYVKDKSLILMIIGGVTLAVQLLIIILACCLFCAIRNEEQKV